MSELFTDSGINTEVIQEYLGDDFYNDPETKQQPTKIFDNIKDESALLKKIVNGERTISRHGKELEEKLAEATKGRVRIPVDGDDEEVIKAYRQAVGVPETADGYELTIPDGDDKQGYDIIAKEVRAAAHEAGISPSKLGKVWDKVVAAIDAQNKDIEAKGLEIMKAEETGLKEELKDKYDEFIKRTDSVLGKFKNSEAFVKILETYGLKNNPAIRKVLDEIAPLVLESPTFSGAGGGATDVTEWPTNYEYDEAGKPA